MHKDQPEEEKYILLETYRKNNSAVKTLVWFVLQNELVFVVTRERTGKVKRLRNNQNVKIAACNMRGNVTGRWHFGTATKLPDDELDAVLKLRNKKYGLMAKIAKYASIRMGKFVAYSIKLEHREI